MSDLYQIDMQPSKGFKGFCANVIVENGVVIDCPPIVKWTRGKPWQKVESYYKGKRATIRQAATQATTEAIASPVSTSQKELPPAGCEARPAEKVLPILIIDSPPLTDIEKRIERIIEKGMQHIRAHADFYERYGRYRLVEIEPKRRQRH